MTWTSPNGSTPFGLAHNVTSFSGTTRAAGNLILMVNTCHSTSPASEVPTTPTNANGRISWAKLTPDIAGLVNAAITNASPDSWSGNVWAGTVLSAGAETVTLNYSGAAPSFVNTVAYEFASSLGSWHLDTWADLNAPAGTSAWPLLTPATNGELYFGFSWNQASATAGSTSGYVYNASADGSQNGAAYNLNCPAGTATAPSWPDGTETYGLMVLLAEGPPPTPGSSAVIQAPYLPPAGPQALPGSRITAPARTSSTTATAYGTAQGTVAGGAGSWVNPASADGAPDGSFATWTAP